jgi:hypothetical protein
MPDDCSDRCDDGHTSTRPLTGETGQSHRMASASFEQSHQRNDLNLIAVTDVDGTMLEALEDDVKRQKKRLGIVETKEAANLRRPQF